jgi:hypothetical protein
MVSVKILGKKCTPTNRLTQRVLQLTITVRYLQAASPKDVALDELGLFREIGHSFLRKRGPDDIAGQVFNLLLLFIYGFI